MYRGGLLVPQRARGGSGRADGEPSAEAKQEPDEGLEGSERLELPGPARELYREILARLQGRVVGHDRTVRRLALAGLQHVMGVPDQRLVLVGPSGVGKTTICRALAHALELPSVHVEVADLAETNWGGRNLSDSVKELERQAEGDEHRMRRAVVILDELDKVGTGEHTGSGWSYRSGKQQSLLALLGGADVSYGDTYDKRDRTWSAAHALVIGAGVFEGLPSGDLAPYDLVDWGLIPELVGRLGAIIRLAPPGRAAVREILWRGLWPLAPSYEGLGLELTMTDEALEAVADVSAGPRPTLDLRSARRALRAAAEAALVRALESTESEASRIELTAEDLHLPALRREPGIGFP